MSNQTASQLTTLVERARKVLHYEQRGNHQDKVVTGGLELFVVHWAEEASTVCKEAGLDLKPIYRFTEHLEGYRQQDPMQRAASLRAALSILNELASNGQTPPQAALVSARTAPQVAQPAEAKPAPTTPPPVTPPTPPTKSEPEIAPRPAQRETDYPIHLDAGMTSNHAALTLLSADVTAVPGVGPSVAGKLRSLGIRTVRDLLFYFPRQHRDYSKLEKIANIPFDEVTTTIGMIWEVETVRTSKGLARTIATISDETGKLRVMWFNQPYLQKQLNAAKGSYLVVTGVKHRFGNKIEFSVRSHELPEQGDLLNTGLLVPTYSLTEGLNAKTLRRFTKWAVDHYAAMVPDHLPASVRFAAKLLPLPEAVSQIHYPENEQALNAARLRLGFDELFLIQLGMQERRTRWQREAPQGNAFKIDYKKILIDTNGLAEVSGEEDEQESDVQNGPSPPGSTL